MEPTVTRHTAALAAYEKPKLEVIQFFSTDIMLASGDEDQGEWDPQTILRIF